MMNEANDLPTLTRLPDLHALPPLPGPAPAALTPDEARAMAINSELPSIGLTNDTSGELNIDPVPVDELVSSVMVLFIVFGA